MMNFDWLQQPGGMSLQNPAPGSDPQSMGMALGAYGAGGAPAGPTSFGTSMTAFTGNAAPVAAASPGFMGGFNDWIKGTGALNSTSIDPNTGATVQSQGWGTPVLAAGQGLFNAFLGMKQYGLYKDQLNESKKQFGLNYEAQRRTTNSALEDRQRARVASNSGAYQSVGDYMQQNSIKGA